jgi:two-component sensor histidine kinase
VYQQKYYEDKMKVLKKVYDVGISDIKEKYENDKIKGDLFQVSTELQESQTILNQKKRENIIIYTFISVLLAFTFFIFYLLYQRNQSNKTLKIKNKEKDVLIQEIHHRVKNNLQFVSSLINMQINSSDNTQESYSLNDASRRIKAMALVHEMLYNQNEMKGIHIEQYLLELVDSINELVNSQQIPIQFNVNAVPLVFDTQRAIALGMITSELISNSIKYAFLHTENPAITVLLVKEQEKIRFSVEDNGSGLPETQHERKKLGMRLISIFSRQLKGEYRFENKNGYKYIIEFKY